MFISNNNWYDYCTCQRCPCCGKIVRPRLTSTWGDGTSHGGVALFNHGSTTMNCQATSINDPQNAELKSTIQNLIANDELRLS